MSRTKKISDKVIAQRIREKNNQETIAAFEAQKAYHRLRHHRGCKNVDNFLRTPSYPHFIRLIRFSKEVNLPDIEYYLKLMIASKRQPTTWCSDKSYRVFLQQINSSMAATDAIKMSAKELQDLSEKLDLSVREMVELMEVPEILQLVRQRRLSPWLIFNSDLLKKKFEALDEGMQKTATGIMDPNYWTVIMQQNGKAVLLAKKVNETLEI
jgi:hypothetical protein